MDSPVEEDELEDPNYEPPEPIYVPDSLPEIRESSPEPKEASPEPRESRPDLRGNTDIFSDSVNSNDSPSGRGRGVQDVAPFHRERGFFRRPFWKEAELQICEEASLCVH